ncbi:UAA transporter [Amanita muscaria]
MSMLATLSLVFGGCCSNAITLEQVTSTHPHIGSLLTFLQFLVVALYGLPQHLTWTSYGLPRLKPRTVPLLLYLVQVTLFSFISLLNNAAFAYRIPMSVHIIFRSGGLIVSMVLGWTVRGKKYSLVQVASVVLVTIGVVLTTLSASQRSLSTTAHKDAQTYASGIAMLSLALLLSGFLGLVQDWTYSTYASPWQESMFYLHFLSLPLFLFVRDDISSQLRSIHHSSSHVPIPTVYLPLILNTLTQLVCVAGVNRLTTRVHALTVTLVLVVRKAVSLVLSVVGDGAVVKYAARAMTRESPRTMDVDARMIWTGAALVMVGTIGYSFGSIKKQDKKEE